MSVEFKQARRGRPADPRGGLDHPIATPPRGHRPRTSLTPRRRRCSPRPPAVYVAADEARKRELRQRYGYVPLARTAARGAPDDERRGRAKPDHATRASTSSPPASRRRRTLGRRLADARRDPDAFAAALRHGPGRPRRSRIPRGHALGRAGHRAPSTASAGRCSRPSRAASARDPRDRPTSLLFIADRLFREPAP